MAKPGKKQKMAAIIAILKKEYPEAGIRLSYNNEFELLVATILSAQCTDERVNMVTEKLFKKYRSVHDFAAAHQEILEQDIFSTGFYKAKAKNIIGAARCVLGKFRGSLPQTMEELLTIPGVGRKTANVVLGHAFGIPGIVVDTHVTRLANLLGLTATDNAEKIESELMKITPKDEWSMLAHYLISHGRAVCIARRPMCGSCCLRELCPSAKE